MEISILKNIIDLKNKDFNKKYLNILKLKDKWNINEIKNILKINLNVSQIQEFNLLRIVKNNLKKEIDLKNNIIKFLLNDIIIDYFEINNIIFNLLIIYFKKKLNKDEYVIIDKLDEIFKEFNEFVLYYLHDNNKFIKKFNIFFNFLKNILIIKYEKIFHLRYFIYEFQEDKIYVNNILNFIQIFNENYLNNNYKKIDFIFSKNNKNNYLTNINKMIIFDNNIYDYIINKINFKNKKLKYYLNFLLWIMKENEINFYINNKEILTDNVFHKKILNSYINNYFINYIKIDLNMFELNNIKLNNILFTLILIFLIKNQYLKLNNSNYENNYLENEIKNNIIKYKNQLKNSKNEKDILIIKNIINSLNNELENLNNQKNERIDLFDKNIKIKINESSKNLSVKNLPIIQENYLQDIFLLYCKTQNLCRETYSNFDDFEKLHFNLKISGFMRLINDFKIKDINKKNLQTSDILLIIKKINKGLELINFDTFLKLLFSIFEKLYDTKDKEILNENILNILKKNDTKYVKNLKTNINNNNINISRRLINLNSKSSVTYETNNLLNDLNWKSDRKLYKINSNITGFKRTNENFEKLAKSKILQKKVKILKSDRKYIILNKNKKKRKKNNTSNKSNKNMSIDRSSYFNLERVRNRNKFKNLNKINWNSIEKLNINDLKYLIQNPKDILDSLINFKNNQEDLLSNERLLKLKKRNKEIKLFKNKLNLNILNKNK